MTRQQDGQRCVLRLEGSFDGAACRELFEKLAEERGEELLLDFSAAGNIDDRGLGKLADALRERPGVHLVGLREHQLRLLAYLGVHRPPAS